MSDHAVVLSKGNEIVKIKNFKDPKFSIDGKVSSFLSDNGDNYIYCQEIKVNNLGLDNIESLSEGYYKENLYLDFKKEASQSTFSALAISSFNKFFIPAENGDKIQVKKIKIISPYNHEDNLKKRLVYELIFQLNNNFLNSDGSIIEPSNIQISEEDIYIIEQARIFYFSNIHNVNSELDPVLKLKKVLELIKISININNVISKIFPLFDGSEFTEFKNSQISFWGGNIFNNPNEDTLVQYSKSIRLFYKTAYDNQYKYSFLDNNEKFYYFSLCLSTQALSILTPDNKINLLKNIFNTKLSLNFEKEAAENLVIKIASSFYENDISGINSFLEKLVSTIGDVKDNKVLYQCLYDSMSTSFVITEGLINLFNIIVGSNLKPTKTKFQFVQVIYSLWLISRFNPYNLDGTYKPNTIGLRSSSASLVEITSNVDTSNFTYNYTNYIAFDPKYQTINQNGIVFHAITDFELKRSDASPIVIPYHSRKELGVFWDDFTFKFNNSKIEVYQQLKPVVRTLNTNTPDPDDYVEYGNFQIINRLYGTYEIYQPVTILSTDFETRSALSFINGENILLNGQNINSLIPVFVLAFIDQDSDRSDVETLIGFTVDVVSTFSGFGALTKLRHLRWASTGIAATDIGLFTISGMRIVVGGVEFTSGVLSFLANFVECNENDEFCKGVKSFLNILQLACLSVNLGDGIASYAAKRQAARLVILADSNGTGTNSIDNLTTALGGTTEANTTAHTILEFANSSSQFQSLNAIADRVRTILTGKKGLFETSKKLLGELNFIPSQYNTTDILDIVTHIYSKADNYFGLKFDNLCAHLLFIGSKKDKLISKEQLIKQITFYFDEVLKRGFPSGFNNTSKLFSVFCGKIRAYFSTKFKFWDDDIIDEVVSDLNDISYTQYIDSNWGSNFNFTERVELIVQGSAVRKHKSGGVLEYLDGNDIPLGDPGDFEFALRMKPIDFEVFTYIARKFAKDPLNKADFNFTKISSKGFMNFDDIKELFGNDFIKQMRQSIANDIDFPIDKIKFAIVKEGGAYDLEPFLKFNY